MNQNGSIINLLKWHHNKSSIFLSAQPNLLQLQSCCCVIKLSIFAYGSERGRRWRKDPLTKPQVNWLSFREYGEKTRISVIGRSCWNEGDSFLRVIKSRTLPLQLQNGKAEQMKGLRLFGQNFEFTSERCTLSQFYSCGYSSEEAESSLPAKASCHVSTLFCSPYLYCIQADLVEVCPVPSTISLLSQPGPWSISLG